MSTTSLILFILQIIVSLLLIIVVLIQSSDEDSLSGIGASAGKPSLLSHKTSTDLITKITIALGVILILNSFILTSIYTRKYLKNKNIVKDYMEENNKNINIDIDNNKLKNIIDNIEQTK